ncbi:hypothetical protein [Parasphingorhabdus pacifica]
MTSPGQQSNGAVPNPTVLAKPNHEDETRSAEQAISTALSGLEDIRQLPVSEHVERFETLHTALTEALTTAENLSSTSNGYGG